jgi:Cu-processing system permease protein
LAYAVLLLLVTGGFTYLQADPAKTTISLLNIVLMIVPLVSIILGTIQFYNSREFNELIMAQPVKRSSIFLSQYLGLSLSLSAAFLAGTGIPLVLNGLTSAGLFLLADGVLLTFIFTGLAFLSAVMSRDKARGIGLSLIIWFYFALLYDGIVLSLLFYFSDYPLETPMLAFAALNPVDLARITIMMKLDISALMGYTGALYSKFFGSGVGIALSFAFMLIWVIVPIWIALRKFKRKDF